MNTQTQYNHAIINTTSLYCLVRNTKLGPRSAFLSGITAKMSYLLSSCYLREAAGCVAILQIQHRPFLIPPHSQELTS